VILRNAVAKIMTGPDLRLRPVYPVATDRLLLRPLRADGHVRLMNRHSKKALVVQERSTSDG
jgi:hypothetical protein